MQKRKDDLVNELIRQVAQKCAVCKAGRARMVCSKKACHNKQVRANLKKIEQINKEETLCQNKIQDINRSRA